ncbi:MAG: gliding motility-associated C-terminal domain-containing protein [Chitinophagales bacterium]|nr:gliding motility-associated C-terminal domain-containing protein [Chitinophagales bacterium]
MKARILFLFIFSFKFPFAFAQCPMGLAPGPNMIVNGDFEAGNVDFTSEYGYCNTALCLNPEGSYSVGTDASFYHAGWTGKDHTTGTGNFLVANGAATSGKKVWCQTLNIEPNTFYDISYWLTSVYAGSPATLQLYVGGFPFFSPNPAPDNPNVWSEYTNTFQSGLLGVSEVCFVNTNVTDGGNDFGIDDLKITKCECDLTINAGPDKSICFGDSVQLDGSGSIAYTWSPQAGLSCFMCEDPIAYPNETTTYYVSVNGPSGCVGLDSMVLTVFQKIDLHAAPDTSICSGTSVQISSDGAVTYSWSPATGLSNPNISNPISFPTQTTTYFLNAVDEHGCDQNDSLIIEVFSNANSIKASPKDTLVCIGKSVQLNGEGAAMYSWTPLTELNCFDCEDPVSTSKSSITYYVTGVDSNGCNAGTDSVSIEVNTDCSYLVIPLAFSPNNDGRNDSFHAINKNVATFELQLYNRWGQLVFSSNNVATIWNGKFNGADQPVGVYVWHLKASLTDGTLIERNGNVTLVR